MERKVDLHSNGKIHPHVTEGKFRSSGKFLL